MRRKLFLQCIKSEPGPKMLAEPLGRNGLSTLTQLSATIIVLLSILLLNSSSKGKFAGPLPRACQIIVFLFLTIRWSKDFCSESEVEQLLQQMGCFCFWRNSATTSAMEMEWSKIFSIVFEMLLFFVAVSSSITQQLFDARGGYPGALVHVHWDMFSFCFLLFCLFSGIICFTSKSYLLPNWSQKWSQNIQKT